MMQDSKSVPKFKMTPDHLRRLGKSGERHKYDYGNAIIVSGPSGRGGAARLAARGALRMGAGLVSVFAAQDCKAEHAAHLDAIMLKIYADDQGFGDQLRALVPSAICIGPNFGLCRESRAKLFETLSLPVPLCLDADALTLIAREPDLLNAIARAQVVMTPHEGELRRLIPSAFAETDCRVSLAKIGAQKTGCTLLFKGTDTIVARPDGVSIVVESKLFKNAAWLATAGSGDVLSGFITGLMARGFDAFDAAALGANLHLQCAEIIGPGLIAEDLSEVLPQVLERCLGGLSGSD